MFLSSEYLQYLSKELDHQIKEGNQWAVFDAGSFSEQVEDARYFKTKEDAIEYCLDNVSDTDHFTSVAIEPLYNTILKIRTTDLNRSDIDYYAIDERDFDVSRVLKRNPDQNSLPNSDGNVFTDELISHIEGEKNSPVDFGVVSGNFEQLRIQLLNQGYDPDFFLTLEASMLKGSSKHEERSYDHIGSEIVMYNHLFAKNKNGHYSLDTIGATLYFKMDIDHATINCVDTKKLDSKMFELNWAVDGHRFLKQQEPLFKQLCADPNGRLIAVQLFNNHVSPYWLNKPDFLLRLEDELKIYPKMEFPGDTSANKIYEGLKTYQQIATAISRHFIPEAQDKDSKATLIEKLVKGEPCFLYVPIGPLQPGSWPKEQVRINWDALSKKLSFELNGKDAAGYFEKKPSRLFNCILEELDGYPLRQLNNPVRKQLLVEALLEGHKKPVHLEKKIVLADHIDNYIIVEVSHLLKPVAIASSRHFDGAFYKMNQLGEDFGHEKSKRGSELKIVGLFKGKDLQLDSEGMPSADTGYLVASAKEFSPKTDFKIKVFNTDVPNVVVEQIFVEKDKDTSKLVFSNKYGEPIEIDKEFWKKKEEQGLLVKNRIEPNKGRTL